MKIYNFTQNIIMKSLGNKIKSASDIKSSIKRIAYQVYENNVDESSLVIAGIGKRGTKLAFLLGEILNSISSLNLIHVTLEMDKSNPRNTVKCSSPIDHFKEHSIIIVDDVLNTGSTLIYAVNYFLQIPVKQIDTAVMVNRNHKKFPVKANFKGISLSTSLNDHVKVILDGKESGIYLS